MAWVNQNVCRSFNHSVTTAVRTLSSQECSEVLIVNRGVNDVYIIDNEYSETTHAFVIKPGESFTFRGITNTSTVSAYTTGATTNIYYRTAYYSSMGVR